MESIKRFNGLNGTVASREDLQTVISIAQKDEQNHIIEKLNAVLEQNEDKSFTIEIVNPATATIPQSMLNGLQLDDVNEFDLEGLNKPVSTNEIYQMVTDKIIEALEQPLTNWEREWGDDVEGYALAYNFASKKVYRSVNQIILNPRLLSQKYPILKNPYFLTFKQVSDLGGKVKKDSKGHVVTYYSFLYSCVFADINVDFKTYDRERFIEYVVSNNILARLGMNLPLGAFIEQSKTAFLKYYKIFNGVDIEGIDFDLDNFDLPGKLEPVQNHHEPIDICEQIIANYPTPKPAFTFGGASAHFEPAKDVINMPNLKQFKYVQAYYTTYFHEIIHSTGLKTRLDRDLTGQMKKQNKELQAKYAFEELIAEIGAMFLCSQSGILHFTLKNSLAYVKSWRQNLLLILKEDNKFVFRAATQSQKAVDFLLEDFEFVKAEKAVEKPKKPAKKKVKKLIVAKSPELKNEPENIEVPAIEEKPVKVDANGQTALFGVKKTEKLSSPVVNEIVSPGPEIKTVGKIKSINETGKEQNQFFKVNGAVGKFLQQVERKPFESVVITMDGMQGAGKTTTLYKFIDAFASAGNSSLFISGEEHPESSLAVEKRDKYLSAEAKKHTAIVGDVENIEQLYQYVEPYDIIFIDSWQKLQRMVGNIRLDEDLRKKFNGKVFVVIFQQTTTGRTKGGAEVVFDGDIIIKMIKEASFSENYAYFDKNRYTKIPIENIRYNIATGEVYNPNEPEPVAEPIAKPAYSGSGFAFQV